MFFDLILLGFGLIFAAIVIAIVKEAPVAVPLRIEDDSLFCKRYVSQKGAGIGLTFR